MTDADHAYVSRGGLKLAAAIDRFATDVRGLICADLGCSTGGFTDCLLQHGATRVYSVDTAYGEFAWKLRNDPRVQLHERTNALHAEPAQLAEGSGEAFEGVDLVVIDLGWTRQARAIPTALRWLKCDPAARIITLIKPHYEQQASSNERKGVLDDQQAAAIADEVLAAMPQFGVNVIESMLSPIRGGKGKGNVEYLAMLEKKRC